MNVDEVKKKAKLNSKTKFLQVKIDEFYDAIKNIDMLNVVESTKETRSH